MSYHIFQHMCLKRTTYNNIYLMSNKTSNRSRTIEKSYNAGLLYDLNILE